MSKLSIAILAVIYCPWNLYLGYGLCTQWNLVKIAWKVG